MSTPSQEVQPLSLAGIVGDRGGPFFLRRIARSTPWNDALATRDITAVTGYLYEHGQRVSLWQVNSDLDLRRVAIAINESRESFTERVEFLPILPDELNAVGVTCEPTTGETSCPAAAILHYDAEVDETKCSRIITMLINAGRRLARCTKGQMSVALRDSQSDGCFAVSDSLSCKCGADRSQLAV